MTLAFDNNSLELTISRYEGYLFIDVPWDKARLCHDRLRNLGIDSTLVRDITFRLARLELTGRVTLQEVETTLQKAA